MYRKLFLVSMLLASISCISSSGSTEYAAIVLNQIIRDLYNSYEETFQKFLKIQTHIEVFTNEIQSQLSEKCSSSEEIDCYLEDDLQSLNEIREKIKGLVTESMQVEDLCANPQVASRPRNTYAGRNALERNRANLESEASTGKEGRNLLCQWDKMFELKKQNSIIRNEFEESLASIYDNYQNCMSTSLGKLYNEQC